MKKKKALTIVLLVFLVATTITALSMLPTKAFTPTPVVNLNPLPDIYVDPPTIEVAEGLSFNVSVYVDSTSTNPAMTLQGWEAGLQWNSTALSLTSYEYPSLGGVGGASGINSSVPEQTYEYWAQIISPDTVQVTSPLKLLTATFQSISVGSSQINLIDALLINSSTTNTTTYDRPPDIDGDGSVDMFDAGRFAHAFFATPSSPHWNPACDFDDNGVVNIIDYQILLSDGGMYGPPWPTKTVLQFGVTVQNASVTVSPGVHDVGVDAFVLSKTAVGQGFGMNVEITAANLGTFTETFDVKIYANASLIGALSFSLAGYTIGAQARLWNTSGLAYGNYFLQACADVVPSDANETNNNSTGGWVRVGVVGDLTSSPPANPLDLVPDGQVDMADVGVVASMFNQPVPPAPRNCDITSPDRLGIPDGLIDMADVGTVAAHFNEHE